MILRIATATSLLASWRTLLSTPLLPVQSFSTERVVRSARFSRRADRPTNSVLRADNKAMAFLRQKGRVGGGMDLTHAIGHDEGPLGKAAAGKKPLTKSVQAYPSCAVTGILENMSEPFPTTAVGTTWAGWTDQVMGGQSRGMLVRHTNVHGRMANVLHGQVRLANNGGFVQMAADLVPPHGATRSSTVDMSQFTGVELVMRYEMADTNDADQEHFNVHLKTSDCPRPFSSYRSTFALPAKEWTTVRLPFADFVGHGPGASECDFDRTRLKRVGVVAIGKEMDVALALSSFRFYQ